ncbi:LPXTG-site transpeptidase (sortase) family protein [Bacilli bacterium PM5-3]|nr:LPXTG-site transpeptidase (sortase) family protein [Bacilli bacterium PM5-3]MDH6604314.1 LPXTG-site transpeptidase (sortase) family protein [Bacilli bacterium PM5-9]
MKIINKLFEIEFKKRAFILVSIIFVGVLILYLNYEKPQRISIEDLKKQSALALKQGGKNIVGKFKVDGITDEYAIINGNSQSDLMKGVGMRKDSILPINNGVIFLEGHRESVGYNYDDLCEENTINVYLKQYNKTYKYKMIDKVVVKSNNEEYKVYNKIQEKNKKYIVLLTCYPTKEKSLNPTKRLAIIGELFN